jgi:hypothetical protein
MKKVLKNLIAGQLVKRSSHSIVSKGSMPYSQKSATDTYPEPDETSPRTPSLFISENYINVIPLSMPTSPSGISGLGFPTQILYA